jgi:hypothetical protein
MAGFCPNCGTPATDDAIFCRGCGVKLAEAIAAAFGNRASAPATNETAPGPAATPGAPVEQPVSRTTPSPTAAPAGSIAPSKSGGCGKEILVIVLVFALLAVAGVGIAIYLAQ